MKLPNAATWCGRRFFAGFAATHTIDASPASPMRKPVSCPFLICSPVARSRSPQSTPIAPPGVTSFVGNAASPLAPVVARRHALQRADSRRPDYLRPIHSAHRPDTSDAMRWALRQGMRRPQTGCDTDERRGPHRAAIAVPGKREAHPVCLSAQPGLSGLAPEDPIHDCLQDDHPSPAKRTVHRG